MVHAKEAKKGSKDWHKQKRETKQGQLTFLSIGQTQESFAKPESVTIFILFAGGSVSSRTTKYHFL